MPTPEPDAPFNFSNLPVRPGGKFLRLGAKFLPGIRKVQQQIVPYAEAWGEHNRRVINHDKPLWVALGDSMTQGIGAGAHDNGWVGQLDQKFKAAGKDYRIINLSISGARIRDVIDRQLPAMQALGADPDLVTVYVGANDLVRKKFRVNAVADYDELLEKIPEGSIVANLLGGRSEPRAMDRRLQRAVSERGLTMVDIRRDGPRTWKGMVAEDFFHPNERGYKEIARIFAKALGLPN